MSKIHYTIYEKNYGDGENTRPMCNDNVRMSHSQLTQNIEEITCKRCIKSKLSYVNMALEMVKEQTFQLSDGEVEALKNKKNILENMKG